MSTKCTDCGEEFSDRGIGHHWRQSSCSQPTATSYQHELVTGLLMGDGNIESRPSGSILSVDMINKPFLKWLNDELGKLSTGVKLSVTAEKSAEYARKSGFRPNADESNYHDVYSLRTRTLSDLDRYSEWYSSGEKVFPDISLNRNIVKMWYVSDGGLSSGKLGRNQAQIRCTNESDRIKNLHNMFLDIGFDPTITNENTRLAFSSNETEKLLKYMGDAPPGFEYKWKSKSQEEYLKSKRKTFTLLEQ